MKTACLTFSCPSCNTNYEIFLKTSPHVMILNCPTCKTCVSLYNGKISEEDKQLIKKLHSIKNKEDLKDIIEQHHENELVSKSTQLDRFITNDDIVNLKIDLNNCKTIDDVLSLCQK